MTIAGNAASVGASLARRRFSALLALSLCALALLYATGRDGLAADAATVQYAAGWDLVAVTTGTPLDAAQGPAYILGPSGYEAVAAGDLVAGRAAWLYFPQTTTVTLGSTAAEYSRTNLPVGGSALVGNPSATAMASISGADLALIYDPSQGYIPANELRPGQGAFVYAAAGGSVTLGKAPAGAATDELDQVRAALVATPTDRTTLDRLARDTDDLLRTRRYDQVQTAVDDMRAAVEQGLQTQGSGPLPPLSTIEQNSAATVREALARAKVAAASNDTATADAARDQARRAAQAAVADAVSIGRGGDSATPDTGNGSRSYTAAGGALNPLAAAGLLLRGASFAFALGVAQGDDFWSLEQQLQSGQLTLPDTTLPTGSAGLPPAPPPLPSPADNACLIDPAQLVLDSEEQALLIAINSFRAQNGLPALRISIALQRTAASKVADMAAHHLYAHDDGFPDQHTRFIDCGYPAGARTIGENLNGGHANADAVLVDWLNDQSHRDNLLSTDFQYIGIKRAKLPDPADPLGWVWAADFGSDPDSS